MSEGKAVLDRKIKVLHLLMLLTSLLVFVFLFRWQVAQASKFTLIAKSRVESSEIDSMRGTIYSKDGSTLAYSEPRFDMNIWMDDLTVVEERGFQTRDEFLKKVGEIIGEQPKDLAVKIDNYLENGAKWIPIAKLLTKEQWQKLKNLTTDKDPTRALTGYSFEFTSTRIYPEGRLASHVLGLTNTYKDKIIGAGGLEDKYNNILNPIKGFIIQERDAIGQSVAAALLPTIEPKNGSSIYTSIDKKLQATVESEIKKGVEKYQASSGTVIIMDPKDGEIMAMANFPDYDPNTREADQPSVYGNIAVTSPYEMGSVGKIITAATAIDLGVTTSETIIMPEGHEGCEKIHNDLQPICTWDKKPQPPMPLWECFANSDNICFFHTAEQLGRKDFYDYLVKFGVGKSTGVDLKEDSPGILKYYDAWNVGDVAAFSYGHGYLVNTVQAIDAVASIANYGLRMQPKIVSEVVDSNGEVNEYRPVILNRTVKKETAETVVEMMRINYERSFAANEFFYAPLKNYDIAVKSGTALIANSTGYTLDINATFVGFDASPQRTFVMLVRLEKPQIPAYDRLAYYNVRPLWLDIFNAVKDHLGVPTK